MFGFNYLKQEKKNIFFVCPIIKKVFHVKRKMKLKQTRVSSQ